MTAWAFPNATMRTRDTRGQLWGPVLRLPKEVQEDEEAQRDVEVWCGEEKEGKRTGVQLGWDTVRGLQEEDDGVAVSFRMTDTGRPDEEAPIVPVGHKCGESARRIRLTVHGLPADRNGTWFWYRHTWSRSGRGGTGHGVTGWWGRRAGGPGRTINGQCTEA